MTGGNHSETLRIARRQAIDWQVRLTSGEASDEDWQRHAEWLLADKAHQAAYEEVERLLFRVADGKNNILEMLEATPALVEKSSSHRRLGIPAYFSRRPFVAATALAATLVLALLAGVRLLTPVDKSTELATAVGEIHQTVLDDGSKVDLDARSEIRLRFSTTERLVELAHGAAVFDVETNPNRPFIIETEFHRVRAIGTTFEVENRDQTLRIAVIEGTVAIDRRGQTPATDEVVLATKGEQIVMSGPSSEPTRSSVVPGEVGAWREGRLIFDNAPLPRVAARLNDYLKDSQFEVPAPEAAEIRFTGVLQIADADTLAQRLEGLLPVTVTREGEKLYLRRITTNNEDQR